MKKQRKLIALLCLCAMLAGFVPVQGFAQDETDGEEPAPSASAVASAPAPEPAPVSAPAPEPAPVSAPAPEPVPAPTAAEPVPAPAVESAPAATESAPVPSEPAGTDAPEAPAEVLAEQGTVESSGTDASEAPAEVPAEQGTTESTGTDAPEAPAEVPAEQGTVESSGTDAPEAPAEVPAEQETAETEIPSALDPVQTESITEDVEAEDIPAEASDAATEAASDEVSEENGNEAPDPTLSAGNENPPEAAAAAEGQESQRPEGNTMSDSEPASASGEQAALNRNISISREESSVSQTVSVTLNDPDRLTVTIKGLSDESRDDVLRQIESGIDIVLEYYPRGSMIIQKQDLVDAEKYKLSGYDENLCWAATAANMLWTSNYAQQAVNPKTDANFQSVDEVFDYFREVFRDEGGNTNAAFNLFFAGSERDPTGYSAADWMKDESQKIEPLLPDEEDGHPYGFEYDGDKFTGLFESIKDMSLGLVLHSVDAIAGVYTRLNHSVTAAGIVIDENETNPELRYKAILIADSDNSSVVYSGADPGPDGWEGRPDDEKAAMAEQRPNIYTLYPMHWVFCGEHYGYRWGLAYNSTYTQNPGTWAIIDAIAWIRDRIAPETDEQDEDGKTEPEKPAGPSVTKPEAPVGPAVTHVPETTRPDYDFAKIRKLMREHDWIIYSPEDWHYKGGVSEGLHAFVHTMPEMLMNVFLDGEQISVRHGDFRVIDGKNGVFLIIFNEELMRRLEPGEHILLIQLSDYGDITVTIYV